MQLFQGKFEDEIKKPLNDAVVKYNVSILEYEFYNYLTLTFSP